MTSAPSRWLWPLLWSLLWSWPAAAAIEAYPFDDPAQEQRFRLLIDELRCPKCQNQTIGSSDAPIAADLRQKVYTMVKDGADRDDVVAYMVQRYGDFVTYKPPLRPLTWLLWFGPLAGILAVLLIVTLWIRRRGKQTDAAPLNADEQARLQALLAAAQRDSTQRDSTQ